MRSRDRSIGNGIRTPRHSYFVLNSNTRQTKRRNQKRAHTDEGRNERFYSSTAWAEMQATTTLVVDRVLRFLIPKRTKMKSRKLFESAAIATAAYRPMPAGGASPRSAGMRPGSSFGTVRGYHGVDGNSPSSYFPLISRAGRASISSTSSRRSPTSGQPLRHRSTSCSIGSFCAIRRKQASGAVPRRRST